MATPRFLTTLMVAIPMAASPAAAADWIYITTSSDDVDIHVDRESISRSGTMITAWERWDHAKNEKVRYREEKRRNVYDCAKAQRSIIYSVEYYPDGESKSYGPWAPTWVPVVPDTIGESTFKFVCGG